MNNRITLRVIADVAILLCIFQGWWFIAFPISAVSTWTFTLFIEIIAFGVFYDSLYGMLPDMGIWGYFGTIVGASIFVIIAIIKKVVRK